MLDFENARQHMVAAHLARRGIRDPRVLEAMRQVPREVFVEEGFEEFAYEDSPLPIGHGQTISQPFIVAHMVEMAEVEATDRVLEVGTGSGYAAAIIAKVADRVFTVERHGALGEMARRRLKQLDIGNVELRIGDGSKGWPEKAPFDAIIVAAGGPVVPEALKDQLDIGGRLIIPVGINEIEQRLVRVTRVGAKKFEEEDLGGVMFVPLIGEHGWSDTAERSPGFSKKSLPELICHAAEDLPEPEDQAFGGFFDRFADRRIVLLGEATHGTSEFYRARAAITRRLIEHHGFSVIALEADWPDASAVNRFVRGLPARESEPTPFRRFPTWMWRNREFDAFLRDLRTHNEAADPDRQARIYGLDIYNMSGSIAAVLAYLDEVDPEAAAVARERYGCLTPWQNEPSTYGRAVLTAGYRNCEDAVAKQCRELLENQLRYASDGGDEFLDAAQNARLIASAERYYRVMYYGGAETWNLRDRHMFETLEHLLDARGSDAKAVVWAHNSHVGDARETEIGKIRRELNIGQLCREKFGSEIALIGFGTHAGTVAAASDWDGPMEVKKVRPSHEESVERCFNLAGKPRAIVDFRQDNQATEALATQRLERFIGVIYRPETELLSHYAEASLSRQFDAFVWFDETKAVTSLPFEGEGGGRVPDTFPFGL
ncbi:protein-L-isoaspartate(D-aspartate) O-methyltransferase [Mesorhizobium sp. WSM4904]|uniref:protein-L-isoaspartate(D-aspartate) O-methyltransferase n=1 Tax=Mesorhizobium sp. WSM4904 TaxID=3038545 RepID=UPI0024182F65|nr:protein-L-isoaspartate(D-aspartate) O-methyltransferase [Mesorhizobium sp. WSM4904]WFP65858.1 protein-L-isoaspartate(D-aspartate) O-methyltransferase [Mesorhizobium sp. WSM4904]